MGDSGIQGALLESSLNIFLQFFDGYIQNNFALHFLKYYAHFISLKLDKFLLKNGSIDLG